MWGLLSLSNLIAIIVSGLILGGYALLPAPRREAFFGYFYFAYASASDRWPASGGKHRD